MELKTLLDRCRQGDALAWETLVRQYQGRIYGVAYYYTGNVDEARDLAQEIFVKIYQKLDSCTNDETFVPWMIRLARNASIDRLRRLSVRPTTAGIPVEDVFDLQAKDPTPDENWRTESRKELLHRALQGLSQINREIILLKEIQGLTLEEVAEILKIPLGTAKSRSNRARLELARELMSMTGGGAGLREG